MMIPLVRLPRHYSRGKIDPSRSAPTHPYSCGLFLALFCMTILPPKSDPFSAPPERSGGGGGRSRRSRAPGGACERDAELSRGSARLVGLGLGLGGLAGRGCEHVLAGLGAGLGDLAGIGHGGQRIADRAGA